MSTQGAVYKKTSEAAKWDKATKHLLALSLMVTKAKQKKTPTQSKQK
jgi:hypothetical protein